MPVILKAIFFTAAVVCFVVDAFWKDARANRSNLGWVLIPLGLALFAAPFAFDAWAAVD